MDNVTFVDLEDVITDTVKKYAIIEHEDGSQTSMLKTAYDELKANEAKTV